MNVGLGGFDSGALRPRPCDLACSPGGVYAVLCPDERIDDTLDLVQLIRDNGTALVEAVSVPPYGCQSAPRFLARADDTVACRFRGDLIIDRAR